MKPCNFPGRKHARRARAAERTARPGYLFERGKGARIDAHPTVCDTRFRIGAKNRNADGTGRTVEETP